MRRKATGRLVEVQNGQKAVIGISSCLIMDMHIINDDDQGVRERQSSLLITVDMYFYLVEKYST